MKAGSSRKAKVMSVLERSAVKLTDSVVAAPHQRDVFRVRPAQGHGCAGRLPFYRFLGGQIIGIPELFGDHSALVAKFLHRFNERHRVLSGCQFIMPAFPGQNRPGPAFAGPIERIAVCFLSVAVVIITTPARALGQVPLQHSVDHFDG